MSDVRDDRIALDPTGSILAIRDYSGDSWFVFDTGRPLNGRRISDVPDDWTYYTPATDRDRLADEVQRLTEEASGIASGLAWLKERSARDA